MLKRRSFTDVHELVYLFHSWQLLLEVENIPEVLRPLQQMPPDLVPAMTIALAEAQSQLESAQSGREIALRFAVTPGFVDLMRWGAGQLAEIQLAASDDELHVTWKRALELAGELVAEALDQLERAPAFD
ncbi:MAG: hypothetical protein ACRDKG_03040 [Actinomycetota bacterium]